MEPSNASSEINSQFSQMEFYPLYLCNRALSAEIDVVNCAYMHALKRAEYFEEKHRTDENFIHLQKNSAYWSFLEEKNKFGKILTDCENSSGNYYASLKEKNDAFKTYCEYLDQCNSIKIKRDDLKSLESFFHFKWDPEDTKGKVLELHLWVDCEIFPKFNEILSLLSNFQNLQKLELRGIASIDVIAKYGNQWPNLQSLNLNSFNIISLPKKITEWWPNLESLIIDPLYTGDISFYSSNDSRFKSEQTISFSFPAINSPFLKIHTLKIANIADLSENFGKFFPNLTHFTIQNSSISHMPESISLFAKLKTLNIQKTQIESLPDVFDNFPSLSKISISECPSLNFLPHSLGSCSALKELIINYCPIDEIPPFDPPIQIFRFDFFKTGIRMLPRGLTMHPNYYRPDQVREFPWESYYGANREMFWELGKRSSGNNNPGNDDDPIIEDLMIKYQKHVSQLAEMIVKNPNNPNTLTEYEWERLEKEGGFREQKFLEPILPANHPVIVGLAKRIQITQSLEKIRQFNLPTRSLHGVIREFYNIIHDNYPNILKDTTLHPKALELIEANSPKADKLLYEYYKKSPRELARNLANDLSSLTIDEQERLKWEGMQAEQYILNQSTNLTSKHPILNEIASRLNESSKKTAAKDRPILL